ncbi:hypothetical protein BDV98DRAFT_608251 [Pterulicium gracile]|uniref:Uncharacterized protein n=1 Tax=Pterulicium gracile TaxID=1884261 RepID=A0A5C3Q8I0_9AGAR|nr:hypothetical protein BDV98DRAFT_608251 [Pterula gracilis]
MAFRNEALRRLTNGSIGLAVFTLITLIWPFPSLPYSIYAVLRHQTRRAPHDHDFASTPSFLSWAEVIIAFLLVANIAQSALALQFPPKPIQPKATPARPKATPSTQSSTKRLAGLSPNIGFQEHSPFSPNSSFALSQSNSSSVAYTPPKTFPNQSLSMSSLGTPSKMRGTSPTPSPMLAAYRGRLNNSTAGRALDGSFLNQLSTPADSDGDEE